MKIKRYSEEQIIKILRDINKPFGQACRREVSAGQEALSATLCMQTGRDQPHELLQASHKAG